MSRFEVAFSGQTVPGIPLDTVKSNLARLFQADEQRIALLFSGRRVVIKNNLDAAGAEKYRTVMERAGAMVEVVDLDAGIEEIELAPPPADPEAPPPLKVAPRDEYMAAFSDVDAPDFGLAPVGADLQDAKSEPQRPPLDLSEFSVAPVGSDMGQAKAPPPAPVPDTSHLKLME
ncbi:hypothetical protein D3C76_997950 [compost metagenome]